MPSLQIWPITLNSLKEGLKRDEDPSQDRNPERVSDIADAFSLFQTHLKKELKNLKEQISEENELSHRRISKKIKLNKESQFKSPGNRKQFTFNENLIHNLEDALRAVKTEKYDRAKSVIRESLADLKKQNKLVHIADKSIVGWMRQRNMAPIVLPLILKMRKGSDVLNSMLSAKESTRWKLKQCQEACNLGSLVVVLSLVLVTILVIVASHFLAMETCANSINPDTVSPVVWQDIGERIVHLFGTLHNEHNNDLKRSSSRFKVPHV